MDQELADFRKRVVKVAQRAAEENDWCEVVDGLLRDDLQLGDLLPPQYVVQSLESRRHRKWQDSSVYTEKNEAVDHAEACARSNRQRRGSAEPVSLTVRGGDNLQGHLDRVKRAWERVQPADPCYPRYRVVERTGSPSVETVVKEVS